jgi:hypothetical protein
VIKSRTLGAVGALAVLALTGCGAVQPGTAVEVGDETISTSRVDEVTAAFCTAIEPQLEQQAQTIPNGYFRGGVAATLALRSVADQIAADRGVEADSEQYVTALRELRRSVAGLPEDVRDSVIEVNAASAYVEAVQAGVGEQELEGDGEYQDFVEAGAEVFTSWIAENDVEFDPALNTTIEGGTIATRDESLSFAVSDVARAGMEEQPNAMMARQLPETHRCGR